MNTHIQDKNRRITKQWSSMMILVLLTSLLAVGCTAPSAPPSVQPSLLALIEQQPAQSLRLIVQAGMSEAEMADRVASLGGRLIYNLSILHAYALEVPANAVPALARTPGVRWVSLDGPVEGSGTSQARGSTYPTTNTYLDTLRVRSVWSQGIDGLGVTVAIIDSGIAQTPDFQPRDTYLNDNASVAPVDDGTGATGGVCSGNCSRILARQAFNRALNDQDSSGHGTHVAGIIAGNGSASGGPMAGVAPQANLLALNISDGSGMAYESDTVAAMQWVLQNKSTYNIRVVNLSINSTVQGSYHDSALDAAAEILWFNGIVVVASSGNKGGANGFNTASAAPANDPFVITVGATDERGTATRTDDMWATFTAFGNTKDGYYKPELMAPGKNIYSVLAPNSAWDKSYPERKSADGKYFRISGTSMAAPMVAGAVALLLQDEPNLTPDQVKYRLTSSGTALTTSKYLDVYAAVNGSTTASANMGIAANRLLWTGSQPVVWNSVNWNSVNWNSVNWNSVNWNSVNWNSVDFSQ